MSETIRFPSEAEVLRRDAEAFQRLPPDERLTTIFDLIASGVVFLGVSPQRTAGQRLRDADEEAWRRAQKEVFTHHGY